MTTGIAAPTHAENFVDALQHLETAIRKLPNVSAEEKDKDLATISELQDEPCIKNRDSFRSTEDFLRSVEKMGEKLGHLQKYSPNFSGAHRELKACMQALPALCKLPETLQSSGKSAVAATIERRSVDAVQEPDIHGQIARLSAAVLGTRLQAPPPTEPGSKEFATKLQSVLKRVITKEVAADGSTSYAIRAPAFGASSEATGRPIRGAQAVLCWEFEKLSGNMLDLMNHFADDENVSSLKSGIRSLLSELSSELNREGGAIPARVESLWSALEKQLTKLGAAATTASTEKAKQGDQSVVAGEEDKQNQELLNDYIASLKQFVDSYKNGIENAKGTKLALLLQSVERLPGLVQDIRSLGLKPPIEKNMPTLEQILDWISDSVETAWPLQLADGQARKTDVESIQIESKKLEQLVSGFTLDELKVLHSELAQIENLATEIVS